jgi:hypothetical protein
MHYARLTPAPSARPTSVGDASRLALQQKLLQEASQIQAELSRMGTGGGGGGGGSSAEELQKQLSFVKSLIDVKNNKENGLEAAAAAGGGVGVGAQGGGGGVHSIDRSRHIRLAAAPWVQGKSLVCIE